MTIKQFLKTWRHNVALSAMLEIKRVTPINSKLRDHIKIGNIQEGIKLQGKTDEGVEVYIEIELIGAPELLNKFRFEAGKHAGFVLSAID
jgi:hypothetical protein